MIKLHSDFYDYYDHYFARSGIPFYRMSRDGLDRKMAMVWISKGMGLPTPKFGCGSWFSGDLWDVVVHIDPFAHRGEGKLRVKSHVAAAEYPSTFSVQFIEGHEGVSRRYLRIGSSGWWLDYKSEGDWRSNVGDVTVSVVGQCDHPDGFSCLPDSPLWAIDFVGPYAVDYNGSPGLRGTGMEKILKPASVVKLIEEWHERRVAKKA